MDFAFSNIIVILCKKRNEKNFKVNTIFLTKIRNIIDDILVVIYEVVVEILKKGNYRKNWVL